MYIISKNFEVSIAHQLRTCYDTRCKNLHGHNAQITVFCCSEELNEDGMVIDFKKVKDVVMGKLDHKYLNDVVEFNPTAENLSYWICNQIDHCYKVIFQESTGNVAVYIKPGFEHLAF